ASNRHQSTQDSALSIPDALPTVTRVSRGALSRELERVVAQTRAGDPIVTALDDLVVRTGVTGVARFAEAMAVAIDRGTPLVDVRSEEHTSELQTREKLVCRLLLA